MKNFVRRMLPLAAGVLSLTCAQGADKAGAKGPAPNAARPSGMVVERQAEDLGPVKGGRAGRAAVVTAAEPTAPPTITETVLPNGLVMAESDQAFMSTLTVSKSADGAVSFQCNDAGHGKGPHDHAPALQGTRKVAHGVEKK